MYIMEFYFCVTLLHLFVSGIFACEHHTTCKDCIIDESQCVWCADENPISPRCKSEAHVVNGNWCLSQTINPKSELTVTQELKLNENNIHIVPQKMKLKLRPGQTLDFEFTYKRLENYPLDVYFLMDSSSSMRSIHNDTVTQSHRIYKQLVNLTKDVYLGLGNYVDKNALPYTEIINSKQTYSFKNRLSLNQSFEEFIKVLNETEFGENFDEPEALFDALAQVMVCKREIGWRNQTRKIVVVLTDGSYHIAMDGKWAGIDQPYDGKCYTDNGTYTKELEMDYPSLSLINKLAAQEEISTIFAVTDLLKPTYETLKKSIRGTYVGSLGATIEEILITNYNNIEEYVKLKFNMNNEYRDNFQISFEPDCYNGECKVQINEEKKFKGSIKLEKYLDDDDIQIDIMVEGIKEKLNLDLNIIKECESCKVVTNSTSCSYGGTRRCGVCECDNGRYGSMCECSTTSESNPNNDSMCMAPNSTDVCSGFGYCRCGACACKPSFKGKFCECNTQKCPRDFKRNLCSNNGECGKEICGKCKCTDNWSGADCSCSLLNNKCTDEEMKMCGGRGTCECNACKCPLIAQWDARTEHDALCNPLPSPNSRSRQCNNLQPCVLSYLKKLENDENCKQININGIENRNDTADWTICPDVRADVGCYTRFLYKYNDDTYGIDVQVETKLNCAESYYMVGGGCLAGLILIGVITLICWKFITMRNDLKEYEKFSKDLLNSHTTETENHYTKKPSRRACVRDCLHHNRVKKRNSHVRHTVRGKHHTHRGSHPAGKHRKHSNY